MNLKTIRKSYDLFSSRERFSLFKKACSRQDESEINAIVSASPKILYQVVDFYSFHESVNDLNLVNLLERLKLQEIFDLFFQQFKETDFEKLSEADFENSLDKIYQCGYFYTIETDAWKAVGDEFGFDVQDFRQAMAKEFMTFGLLEIKDKTMRQTAFNEEGMRNIKKNMEKAGRGM